MFSQVQQALDCLATALGGVDAASTDDLRRTLGLAKSLRSRIELLETKAAAAVAQRESHGDGGAALLNPVGGRSRSDAARTRDQRMADALDTLLAAGAKPDGGAEPASEARPIPPAVTKAAEIVVRADLAALAGEPGSIAEICGVGPIPARTLQRLACNSDVWVEIFGDKLAPLYEAAASRAPTAAQRRALIARDGACIGCGEPPGECEAHHITPCQRGGKTRLDNLVLVWRPRRRPCHSDRRGRRPRRAGPGQPAPRRWAWPGFAATGSAPSL